MRSFRNPVVLFGGDVSSSFEIAKIFYEEFILTWDRIVSYYHDKYSKELDPITAELDQVSKELEDWKNKHPWIKNAQKPISDYSDKKVPAKLKKLLEIKEELKERRREKIKELGCSTLWKRDYEYLLTHRFIYAILGNHELWDFNNYSKCVKAYKALFDGLGINFLCDDYGWLGVRNFRYRLEDDLDPRNKKKVRKIQEREFNENDKEFFCSNILIVGGMGFSGLNNSFNANKGIYRNAVNREEEVKRSKAWSNLFQKAYAVAQITHSCLLVFTHMPVSDWGGNLNNIGNCIFINGHTHRNIAFGDENRNFVYSDNQVRYDKEIYHFKKALLYAPRNPFAADPDGYREINIDEFVEYYRYVHEQIPGTGIIKNQINNSDAKLYVMKQDGYVAFFLVSYKGVYICNGGAIKKIGPYESLSRYFMNFKMMIDKYITGLTPLRRAQEEMSAYIKSFGGWGRIHGTIVDIDFTNHVMFNTADGSVRLYYSPVFGLLKTYPDIGSLIHDHCPELEDNFKRIGKSQMPLVLTKSQGGTKELEWVDIKNSPYAISRRVNALQKLLDKRILRDWNPAMEEMIDGYEIK